MDIVHDFCHVNESMNNEVGHASNSKGIGELY